MSCSGALRRVACLTVHAYACRGRSVAAPLKGRSSRNGKLSVLVRMDLDCSRARIAALGHVTARSIQALYVVLKRANALMEGLALEIDVTRARVEPAALEQLRACSRSHHLPAQIDPFPADCRLSILARGDALTPTGMVSLAP